MASWVVHSRSWPRRVCGRRSRVFHSTSWRMPPTLRITRREVEREWRIWVGDCGGEGSRGGWKSWWGGEEELEEVEEAAEE